MDAGIDRITAWMTQNDPKILAAREKLCTILEGVDVYCDVSCLHQDEKGGYTNLICTATGGDKKLSTQSNFGKMYITAFPLRATVVWDDCEDR